MPYGRTAGVAVDHLDVLDGYAEDVAGDLAPGRLVALAVGDVPVTSSTLPVGRTRIVQASQPPATYFSAPSVREGASPHISVNVEMPIPSWTGSLRPAPGRLLGA